MTRKRVARTRSNNNRMWLIGGIAVVAVVVVGLLVWANQGAATGKPPTLTALTECGQATCGQANAPVTVEEYSDFQ